MFGDDERCRFGQVEHLAGAVTDAHGRRHSQPAGGARWRVMIDDPARRGDLPEGLSFMTFLPARRLVRWLAQTLDPRRLFQPVTRRRLAAIRAVQSEPALKFSDMRFQSRDLGRLRRDQRNQLFPRWLGWRSRIHRILESNPDSDVQKNLRARLRQTAYPTWAETEIVHRGDVRCNGESSHRFYPKRFL